MRKTIKRTGFIAVSAVALSTVGVAFAYWTSEGSGTGTGTIGTTERNVVVTATQTDAAHDRLYPGGEAVPLSLEVDNPNTYSVQLNNQKLTLTKVTCAGDLNLGADEEVGGEGEDADFLENRKDWFTISPASTQSPDLTVDPVEEEGPLTGANDTIYSTTVVAPLSEDTDLAYTATKPSVAVAMLDSSADQNMCKNVAINYEFQVN